jgi:hypothetical protein
MRRNVAKAAAFNAASEYNYVQNSESPICQYENFTSPGEYSPLLTLGPSERGIGLHGHIAMWIPQILEWVKTERGYKINQARMRSPFNGVSDVVIAGERLGRPDFNMAMPSLSSTGKSATPGPQEN